jgi:hypothetical protein
MTETQMLVFIGTIWVAPHCNPLYALFVGCVILIISAVKGLGWL